MYNDSVVFKIVYNEQFIKVLGPYNSNFIKIVHSFAGSVWVHEKRAWIIPYDGEALKRLVDEMKSQYFKVIIENKNNSASPTVSNNNSPQPDCIENSILQAADNKSYSQSAFCIENSSETFLLKLEKELISRKYSQKTIKSYLHYSSDFINYIKKPISSITDEEIKSYVFELANTRNYSASSINVAINSIKFLFEEIFHKAFAANLITRPKKDKKLPIVFSLQEVGKIISAADNLKHQLLLMITYSAGLRVGEVINLKFNDIDFERKMIRIISGKGRKDRYTILSDVVIERLRIYSETASGIWVFSGQGGDKPLTIRAAEKIFEKALLKSHVKKDAGIHSLRHSFATHLLETGTDIRYIQKLLGHANVKTTEIYTHVSQKHISKIISPLDTIMK